MPVALVIILFCGVLIKLEDGGPVFYYADRLGKNAVKFKMLKLRTMKVGAPDIRQADGSTWSSEDDIRVTCIGRRLRKTSIDELPQLINVLKGEMSLIGPRPDTIDSLAEYSEFDRKRLCILPGMTGYCQSNYRNSINASEKILKDIYYVDNASFTFDMKIYIKTILLLIKPRNIYSGSTNKKESTVIEDRERIR